MENNYKFPDDFELERLRQRHAFRDITDYLNSVHVSEQEYIAYYNHFANVCNVQTLDSIDDIYGPKNDQESMINYILDRRDPYYDKLVYTAVIFSV